MEDLDSEGEDHIADMWRYVCMGNLIEPLVPEPKYEPMYGVDPLGQFSA